ncbi:MAG TPA: glycosyltransferase, partial [Nitrospirales bacterium]|nr:glycosyltransferase [Nitrospirales bacterium]
MTDWNGSVPKVSVLMTIYNAERYLREAIDSVVAQTFGDWELIAVENGSADASPTILASYADDRFVQLDDT